MAKGDDIQERLVSFAVQMIRISAEFPKGTAGKHLAGQIVRCGTSPAANYAEARSAESTNDFIHKLKIALKELNETKIWLEIAEKSGLLPAERVADTANECDELCRIVSASVRTIMNKR